MRYLSNSIVLEIRSIMILAAMTDTHKHIHNNDDDHHNDKSIHDHNKTGNNNHRNDTKK